MSPPRVHALIPAAGQGTRFGGALLKQYCMLGHLPVLAHSINAVIRHPEITGVTVVVSEQDHLFDELGGKMACQISKALGGATRAHSVLNGLRSIKTHHPGTQWVLVHDAARPCLPLACLSELLKQGLVSADGAILAVPVQDTLKSSSADRLISATVERTGLWAAQTPQLFPLERLRAALHHMLEIGKVPTDEASAMEHSGAKPLLVMGSPANIKITWPEDLAIAQAWLSLREAHDK